MKNFVPGPVLGFILASVLAPVTPAFAGILISFEEVGSDVVATVSGSLTLPAPTSTGNSITINNGIAPDSPFFEFGVGQSILADAYNWTSSFPAYGTEGFSGPGWTNPGTGSGIADSERFLFGSANLQLPTSFVSGAPIDGTITWANQSFTTLGLTQGTYSRGLANDPTQTVTLNVVPEPTTSALGLVSLGCGAAFVIRRARGTKRAPRGAVRQS